MMRTLILLSATLALFLLSSAAYGQKKLDELDNAWITQRRVEWQQADTLRAKERGMEFVIYGASSVRSRKTAHAKLLLVRLGQKDADSLQVSLDSKSMGYAVLPLDSRWSAAWIQKEANLDLGEIRVPSRRAGLHRMDVSVSQTDGRRLSSLIGIRPMILAEGGRQAASLSRTFAALPQAPARIPKGSRPQDLEKLMSTPEVFFQEDATKKDASKESVSTLAQTPPAKVEKVEEKKPSAPHKLEEPFDPTVFATEGLPSQSSDPEIRRIWRMIGNAQSDELKEAAQRALGDYYKAQGDETRATLSYRRADHWKKELEKRR